MRRRYVNICWVYPNKGEDFFPLATKMFRLCVIACCCFVEGFINTNTLEEGGKTVENLSGQIPPGERRWSLVRNYLGLRLLQVHP